MNSNDQIINIIQQFLDSKGNYDSLKPICIVHEGYVTANGVQFSPHEDYKDKAGYKLEINLQDEAVRIEELNKLNVDIEAYNEWAGDRLEYPHLDLYHPYSFLVVRENTGQEKQYKDLWVGGKLYVEIVDEELYKLKDEEDFIPRFNRTIYVYLISKKESAQAEDRWDEKNIWYTPYRNFGDWFDKQPEYVDAKPYFYSTSGKINWTEPLWKLALKMRKRKDGGDFKTYMDAYRYAVRQYDNYSEPIESPKKLVKALENASGQMPKEIVEYQDG